MKHASRQSEPLSKLAGKAPWDGQEPLTYIASRLARPAKSGHQDIRNSLVKSRVFACKPWSAI